MSVFWASASEKKRSNLQKIWVATLQRLTKRHIEIQPMIHAKIKDATMQIFPLWMINNCDYSSSLSHCSNYFALFLVSLPVIVIMNQDVYGIEWQEVGLETQVASDSCSSSNLKMASERFVLEIVIATNNIGMYRMSSSFQYDHVQRISFFAVFTNWGVEQ